MNANSPDDLPDAVLDQAIGWLVRLQSGYADEYTQAACLQWRHAHPLHETAWQALQTSESAFRRLAEAPGSVAQDALQRLQGKRHGRRQALKMLGFGVAITGLGGWGLREHSPADWASDYSTGVGERRQFLLSDGTRLQLNTSSAVDVRFSKQRRTVQLLRGEIFIDTGKDIAAPEGYRSLWVDSRHAQLQAIGTAFGVREEARGTRLRVEGGIVAIHRAGSQPIRVLAGEEYLISADGSHNVVSPAMNSSAWTQGLLVAKRMRLAELLAELARYRHGWLSCDPAIAGLEVSGVFQLDHIDQALDALGDSMPLRIQRFTPLWTRVTAR
ncbi:MULTISPECIES: FecR family protein [unclassified Pseudomonas]|uniref:FecR domain-containing protein n=1 Tax=unclassified Pseudomonas TaxID=196821 RepID=UPI00073001EC|nr:MULTISPECIES: FecR family protein [unclassified Pseudomonas]KSW22745.1 amino acid ABC transporter substrate-binding protein [Pseudomonas sp. ADP]OBP11150.1 amino acid ABC transporter substrate-binding protein [Pseudomonas sp. EGD-AKN5]QOF85564.1 FecR family protein [Pseudomonas sp. ADPe]